MPTLQESKFYITLVEDDAVSIFGPFPDAKVAGDFGHAAIEDPRWNVSRLKDTVEKNPLFRGLQVGA